MFIIVSQGTLCAAHKKTERRDITKSQRDIKRNRLFSLGQGHSKQIKTRISKNIKGHRRRKKDPNEKRKKRKKNRRQTD